MLGERCLAEQGHFAPQIPLRYTTGALGGERDSRKLEAVGQRQNIFTNRRAFPMYNHAPEDYECPLCAIAINKLENGPLYSPNDLIYSDQDVYAMIGVFQWPKNPGNVVVVPNAHYENIYDLPIHLVSRIHDLARGIALAMKSAWKCDGLSIRQHNEPAGNQDVWHYHMHVTPRFHGDELYRTYVESKALMLPEDRARYARDLINQMTDWKPFAA